MGYDVRVTDEKHPAFGKKLTGRIVYYDLDHTGSSPDLIHAEDDEGNHYRIRSNQINMKHYAQCELEEEKARLGAKAGDLVQIIRQGSGTFSQGWSTDGIHLITVIHSDGYVEFDHGKAKMFRPDVVKVEEAVNQ